MTMTNFYLNEYNKIYTVSLLQVCYHNNPAVVLKSFQVLIRLEVVGYSFLKEEILSLCEGALKSVLCQCTYMNSNTQFQINVTDSQTG